MKFKCEISGKPQMMMNVKTIPKLLNLHEREQREEESRNFSLCMNNDVIYKL